jgi:hypothetical protein
MSDVRPNIASAVFDPAQPALSGSIGGKYKISALQSLSVDVGVLVRKPFHGDDKKTFRERTTVSNPSLTYQVVYQAAGIQNVTAVSGTWTTDEAYRAIGDLGTIGFGQTAIYDFGGSKFSAGLAFDASYTVFDKNDEALRGDQSDYQFGFYPFAELVLNDTLNLRTVLPSIHIPTRSRRTVWQCRSQREHTVLRARHFGYSRYLPLSKTSSSFLRTHVLNARTWL